MGVGAIAAFLEPRHDQLVREMWDEVHDRFGVKYPFATPHPHISFHVARRYDLDALQDALVQFADTEGPFRVRTSGVGVFTTRSPVVYVPLVRNPNLSRFHRALWAAVSGCGTQVSSYYRPERWLPHITLVAGGLDRARVGSVVQWLVDHDLDWAIDVDHLAVIDDDEHGDGIRLWVPLVGHEANVGEE